MDNRIKRYAYIQHETLEHSIRHRQQHDMLINSARVEMTHTPVAASCTADDEG